VSDTKGKRIVRCKVGNIINVDKLSEEVGKRVSWYVYELYKIHTDNLLSVILYGSAVDADFDIKWSNINIVLVFKNIGAGTLQKSLHIIDKGRKKKIIAPLFFTHQHIKTSSDTFPMEFLEIKDKHLLLYGEDAFGQLEVDGKNLRLECEQQIKSMLIKLRQSYLEVGLARKGLEKMLHESFRSLMPILRTILRLKSEDIPQTKEELIEKSSSIVSFRKDIFLALLKDKQGDEKIGGKEAISFFDDYLIELAKIAQYVDGI